MGVFIAIEGGDGSGKATQAELYRKYASETLNKNVLKLSFPRYGEASAYYAGRYLDGAYGSSENVHPELGILPYALDRFAASKDIRAHLSLPDSFVISDRYMASNLAHQGAKISDKAERKAFYERTMQTEYDILGIPRPLKNIVLLVPSELAQQNIDKKDARSYTTKKRDIHEADEQHLDRAKANYEELCEYYPDEFTAINCIDESGAMRPMEDIQADIRNLVGLSKP
jgi:dTMP kinase